MLTEKCEDLTFLDNSFRFSSKEEQLMSLRVTRMSALLFIGGRPVGIPGWWVYPSRVSWVSQVCKSKLQNECSLVSDDPLTAFQSTSRPPGK